MTIKGYIQDRDPTDAALILAAYACWGERAAEHLRGDFAFALWDGRLQRMVLARDHFGTRPCYYHRSGSSLVFGSEVQQVRQFQGVGQQLNKRMIAFHIAATPAPHSWTFFQDVEQLAPAHVLVAEESGARASRYWQLDPQQSVRYRQDAEYAEHFLELFQKATIPKLRTLSPPGVLLSGGLDSSAVACTAADYLQRSGQLACPGLLPGISRVWCHPRG